MFKGGAALPWNSPWIDLDSPRIEHPDRFSWRKLLRDLCPPPVLASTSQARPVLLVDKSQSLETLENNGIDLGRLRSAPPAAASSADPLASDEDHDDAGSDLDPRHPEPAERRAITISVTVSNHIDSALPLQNRQKRAKISGQAVTNLLPPLCPCPPRRTLPTGRRRIHPHGELACAVRRTAKTHEHAARSRACAGR